MTPERWQQLKELLGTALELDPAKRPDYLVQVCGNDAALRNDLERLLVAEQKAGPEFLSDPVILQELTLDLPQHAAAWIGRRLGPYQIAEEISAGGMGEVYRAVRADDEYRKEVAIKVVRSGQDSSFVLNRFKNERQILATLDHPNIARLLDGGTTEEGLPYFVMELIEGQRIDEYCDAQKLATTERLNLFLQICSAVMHAHQRLIIHRDIKPGNILVDAEGVPKLLDFGIAKILESSEASNQPEQTISLVRLLTPGYASPEQVKGEPITTASDVYSLGVVLYELLTGRSPYNVPTHTPHELSRAVCEAEPEKPSTAARRARSSAIDAQQKSGDVALSSLREGSPEKLSKRLHGDLDNIILMALRKEPQRRYTSVEQFAEDIRRHLDHLPVIARKDTFGYRTSKFITRNKTGVAVAALVTVALLSATGVTLRQARIAQRRFNDVRQLANSLMFEVHDSIKDLAGSTPARKLLVSKALQYLDSLSQEAAGDASLQRELAAAYEKVGDVQGHPYEANLGDTAGALASYRKALAIRESLASSGSDPGGRGSMANDYERVGQSLESSGDYRAAIDNYRKALVIEDESAKSKPGPGNSERLAGAYYLIAHCQAALGDAAGALDNYRKSAAIRETIIAGSSPRHTSTEVRLAGTYGSMSGILFLQRDFEQAILLQSKAVDIMRELSESDPTNATFRRFLYDGHYWVGYYFQRKGDPEQSLLNYRLALTGFESLLSADPKEVRSRLGVAQCEHGIGTALADEGQMAQGLEHARRGVAVLEELSRADPTESYDMLQRFADAYAALGMVYSHAATQAHISAALRIEYWRKARSADQKSLEAWLKVKRLGALTIFSANEPDRLSGEVAKCDAALAKLMPPTH